MSEVRERLLANLSSPKDADAYLARIGYLGKTVTVACGEEIFTAVLSRVDGEGGIWLEVNGEKRRFTAAEISVRVEGA